jgi:hypothetical protein
VNGSAIDAELVVAVGLPSARKEKTLATFLLLGFGLVAWDGIEPSTRGFSIAMLVKYLAFMRVTSK